MNPVVQELRQRTLGATTPSWANRAADEIERLERRHDEMLAALIEAKSVIGSINAGSAHRIIVDDEPMYRQREEWVRWALDEVLPQVGLAIAKAQGVQL